MRERNPIIRIVYVLCVLAMVAVIGLVVMTERQSRKQHEEEVAQVSQLETELVLTRETESETGVEPVSEVQSAQSSTQQQLSLQGQTASENVSSESAPSEDVSAEDTSAPEAQTAAQEVQSSLAEGSALNDAQTVDQETQNAAPEDVSAESSESESQVTAEQGAMEEETIEQAAEQENPYRPVLTLKQKLVVLQKGETFDAVSYVDSITDDVDNVYALWREIQVSGNYDTDKAGAYTITYYVMDSDGYTSSPQRLVLIVKE